MGFRHHESATWTSMMWCPFAGKSVQEVPISSGYRDAVRGTNSSQTSPSPIPSRQRRPTSSCPTDPGNCHRKLFRTPEDFQWASCGEKSENEEEKHLAMQQLKKARISSHALEEEAS